MTLKQVQQHILEMKGPQTWRDYGEAMGIDYRSLEAVASGRRKPSFSILAAFGVTKSKKVTTTYEWVAKGKGRSERQR